MCDVKLRSSELKSLSGIQPYPCGFRNSAVEARRLKTKQWEKQQARLKLDSQISPHCFLYSCYHTCLFVHINNNKQKTINCNFICHYESPKKNVMKHIPKISTYEVVTDNLRGEQQNTGHHQSRVSIFTVSSDLDHESPKQLKYKTDGSLPSAALLLQVAKRWRGRCCLSVRLSLWTTVLHYRMSSDSVLIAKIFLNTLGTKPYTVCLTIFIKHRE